MHSPCLGESCTDCVFKALSESLRKFEEEEIAKAKEKELEREKFEEKILMVFCLFCFVCSLTYNYYFKKSTFYTTKWRPSVEVSMEVLEAKITRICSLCTQYKYNLQNKICNVCHNNLYFLKS